MSNLSPVLKKTIYLFSANFKLFITFALISGLISFVGQTINNATAVVDSNLIRIPLILINLVYMSMVTTYLNSRILITLLLIIENKIKNQEIDIKKEFKESKILFWGYFVNALTLGLIMLGPIILITVLFMFEANLIITTILSSLSAIFIFYIFYNYGFSYIASILNPNGGSYFKKSKLISNMDKKFTLGFYLIMVFLLIINLFLSFYFQGDSLFLQVIPLYAFIGLILSMIIFPFVSIFGIYSYHYLQDLYIEESHIEINEELEN